ncbi:MULTISPECIES: peptidoglycan-associated lipoprotein Pal [unclassified Luteimonas]
MKTTTRIVFIAALCVAAVGCARQVQEEAPPPPAAPPPTATAPAPTAGVFGPEDLDTDACLRQRVVYFDFDQESVRPEFQAQMACHAKYLRDRPSARITLEGHADERGSRDYNLGLGERRGNAVSSALQANGGSGTQLTTVSYGEERPSCTDVNEDCWARNRRVEIVYSAR